MGITFSDLGSKSRRKNKTEIEVSDIVKSTIEEVEKVKLPEKMFLDERVLKTSKRTFRIYTNPDQWAYTIYDAIYRSNLPLLELLYHYMLPNQMNYQEFQSLAIIQSQNGSYTVYVQKPGNQSSVLVKLPTNEIASYIVDKIIDSKCNMIPINLGLIFKGMSYGHQNSMIMLYESSTRTISAYLYDPHGSGPGMKYNDMAFHGLNELFKYIDMDERIEKVKFIDKRTVSCPIGMQSISDESGGVGYCVMYSLLWLFLIIRLQRDKSIVNETVTGEHISLIERETISQLKKKSPSSGLKSQGKYFRSFITKFAFEIINIFLRDISSPNISQLNTRDSKQVDPCHVDSPIDCYQCKTINSEDYYPIRCNSDCVSGNQCKRSGKYSVHGRTGWITETGMKITEMDMNKLKTLLEKYDETLLYCSQHAIIEHNIIKEKFISQLKKYIIEGLTELEEDGPVNYSDDDGDLMTDDEGPSRIKRQKKS